MISLKTFKKEGVGHVEESENINQITIVMNLESFSLKLKEMENRYKLPRKYLSVQGLVIFE